MLDVIRGFFQELSLLSTVGAYSLFSFKKAFLRIYYPFKNISPMHDIIQTFAL